MEIKEIGNLKIGMWVKTNTGHVTRVKNIDHRFPMSSSDKFPIIYTDDDKTCWSCESIVQYGWNLIIK